MHEPKKTVRCAVYTRKSSEEGLDMEFNSLDAQREACEAYILSQKHEGWKMIPAYYDDGGFSGGNMNRPALDRLVDDIREGLIDCVVVYKVDRLSRSLLDFSKLIDLFEQHNVTFVSVTQQFSTTNSMGRLTLNILLSFAQFEREVIGERIRDKIRASKKKGMWMGGTPPLGYDIAPEGGKLVVNEVEAAQVREIFRLYIQHRNVITVLEAVTALGWTNKLITTKKGELRGGRPFIRSSISRLLHNRLYLGEVEVNGEVYKGQHAAIIDAETWEAAHSVCEENRVSGSQKKRNKHNALLKGIIRCATCGKPMMHTFTQKKGGRRYRYYVCATAMEKGWQACDTKSINAETIEGMVVGQVKEIAGTSAMVDAVEARLDSARDVKRKTRELQINVLKTKLKSAKGKMYASKNEAERAECRARVESIEKELEKEVRALDALESVGFSRRETAGDLRRFDEVWHEMSHSEREKITRLLVEGVEYDGVSGSVKIDFREAVNG